jgi:hypothetical protein
MISLLYRLICSQIFVTVHDNPSLADPSLYARASLYDYCLTAAEFLEAQLTDEEKKAKKKAKKAASKSQEETKKGGNRLVIYLSITRKSEMSSSYASTIARGQRLGCPSSKRR